MHPFRQFITNYTDISPQDWQQVEACLKQREVVTGELILEEGKICRHLFFLEQELLRYFIWKDGKDSTKFFTEAPYCFTSQRSFANRQAANENIEALEISTIWQLTYEDTYRLLELNSWNTFIRELIQEVQFLTEQILVDIQNETAEDRYRKMLEEQNDLVQRVPLKHLASFLGIAPQSLSRIRKKIISKTRS